MSFQTFRTIGDIANVVNNKTRLCLNVPILTFCFFEAIFRTLPESMINYFAIQNNTPNALLYPLAVYSSLVIVCTYINYFLDHYNKLPGAFQQVRRCLGCGKSYVQGKTFVEPAIPYAHKNMLENHIANLSDFVVRAKNETLEELGNILKLNEEAVEKKSFLKEIVKLVFSNAA
ncbi:MAG: hypothetical protein HEEMFOPI_01590 [Holosporales bacterium]